MQPFLDVIGHLEGRDKLTKLCQYSSRGLAFSILSADPKSVLGQRLSALYRATQAARKCFRLGKSIAYIPKIDHTLNNKALTPRSQVLSLVQDVGMCCFFLFDNMQFFANAKVFPFNAEQAGKHGGYLWFCANVAGFILAYEALQKEAEKEAALIQDNPSTSPETLQQIAVLREVRFKKALALLKVTCDLIVSANTAGVRLPERLLGKKLNDGVVGALGCISASVFLYSLWRTQSLQRGPTREKS
ncbi:hypothetical protein, variant 1 [Aphanomyces invadans]|uniref:Peroxisomal biogenesis factor 11 domain-containing protein n=1 Tax=Aphanomyces invadans TaxID=157072 RepID=A0A024UPB9_9STRA|nr:hypothetical protein, variant 1 [Aphanomyces invadans]ETW07697.1 hypothetical protein, variant 1 [Aphanomyces invadans]|eukprot:XP_008863790.1 hypothetical protein, variant 1 [Aphanomyces invadans]